MVGVSLQEEVIRLVVAALLTGAIGWERESHSRPAGLRTHLLVGVGAALLMLVSQEVFLQYRFTSQADPARIAAQVVSGIGFLGAGTILREGATVRGLTTAASLWVAAAIGLAVGAGAYSGAAVTTAVTLTALIYLARVERRVHRRGPVRTLRLRVSDRPGQLGLIGTTLGRRRVDIRSLEMRASQTEGEAEIDLTVRLPEELDATSLGEMLAQLEGVRGFEIEH